ncbi:N-acetyltransferase [Microbacterium sp. W4I20]|uniref:GNAT family N-acetyltransferase n=1 Tax=Microbacterium sp. W4I20 TaxID=3042262 RepID=UPI00278AD139|nr:GNAT family N-acetyltransferase [Microbacterium sp. W4I20]MDQ0727277.1 ribosomal protein S18 acetylase RimI-like enzyme [Microbacterium sp. W4I20]
MVRITEVFTADNDALTALNRLLPQLSSTAKSLEIGDLEDIIAADTTLFLAYVDEVAVGTLSLIFYRTPSGLRSRIEDVVVDESARGHGVGRALTRAAVESARGREARGIDLTSRPSRVAANELYKSEGFELRESATYRLSL